MGIYISAKKHNSEQQESQGYGCGCGGTQLRGARNPDSQPEYDQGGRQHKEKSGRYKTDHGKYVAVENKGKNKSQQKVHNG